MASVWSNSGRGGRGASVSMWRNTSRSTPNSQQTSGSISQQGNEELIRESRGKGRGRGGSRLKDSSLTKMDLMASVSRNSGLRRDGDDLKNFKIQQEYREFIQGKLDGFSKRFPLEIRVHDKQRIDAQESLLILFRKLREGVYASNRRDAFALEVYETSVYLAIIFESAKQIAASMTHLVPKVYQTVTCSKPLCRPTVVLSLLYHLVASYPSQTTYHQQLRSIPQELLPRNSKAYEWINALARSLRTRNFARFAQLYKKQALATLFDEEETLGLDALSIAQAQASKTLAKTAILVVLDNLRSKARETAWGVIRSAYRELSCGAEAEGDTKTWLTRSLSLQPLLNTDDRTWTPESWLDGEALPGHTRRKEGAEGRWIVCKVK